MEATPAEMKLPSCPLLDKMSAELRNTIYELAFTPDHEEDQEVRLFAAKPPSNSLIKSCRQIYGEAKGYYLEAYQKYWRATDFAIWSSDLSAKRVVLSNLKARDIDEIVNVCIWYQLGDTAYMRYSYVLDHGVWTTSDPKEPLSDRPWAAQGLPVFKAIRPNPSTILKYLARRLTLGEKSSVPLHQQLALWVWSLENDVHDHAIPVDWLPQWR